MSIDTYEAPLIVQDGQGRRFINREKLGENWFVLRMDDYPLTVPAGESRNSGWSIPEDAGHAGDFEIAGIAGYSTVPFRFTMEEVGIEANAFMNVPIHHSHISGMRGLPFVCAESVFCLAGRLLRTQVYNLSSNTAAVVRLCLVGRRFNNEMGASVRESRARFLASRPTRAFWLGFDDTTETLSSAETNHEAVMTVPSGSSFLADDLMVESTGPFEFQLYDAQNGRQLTFGTTGTRPGFVDSRILGGTGQIPAKMLGAPLMQPKRSLRIVMNDLAENGNNLVHMSFHGRRIRTPVG